MFASRTSSLNRWAEVICTWALVLFAGGTLIHVGAGLVLVGLAATGVSWPYWLDLIIVPILPLIALGTLIVVLPIYYFTNDRTAPSKKSLPPEAEANRFGA